MKFIVRLFVVLLMADAILIYMHYSQSTTSNAQQMEMKMYNQEIEITNRKDGLHILHHFNELPDTKLELVWPKESVKRSCGDMENAAQCSRLNEETTAFEEGDNTGQSVSYIIPHKQKMTKSTLFAAPFVTLKNASVSYTSLHVTDEIKNGGIWVSGLQRVGRERMKLIDYSYYKGAGTVQDLYWHKRDEAELYNGKAISVYGTSDQIKDIKDMDETLERLNASHTVMVIGRGEKIVESRRFMITPANQYGSAADKLVMNLVSSRFIINENNDDLQGVLTSIVSGKESGSKKAKDIYVTLTESITEEEITEFTDRLQSAYGTEMNAPKLDSLLAETTGFGTSFFTENIKSETANYPLLHEDLREAVIDGEKMPDVRIILKNGQTLYPAKPILQKIGYTVEENERSIYIKSAKRDFRFPKNELFYVYNDKKYDLVHKPFVIINKELYFQEDSFRRLFLVSIDKTGNTISINSLSNLLEGASES